MNNNLGAINQPIDSARSAGILAAGSIASAVAGAAILIIPFVGVFAAAVLDPLAIGLGIRAAGLAQENSRHRRAARAGLSLGSFALGLLVMFLVTGEYSESAR